MKRVLTLFLLLILAGCQTTTRDSSTATGPWNIKALSETPVTTWGGRSNLVQEVYYAGVPFQGKSTRIFAYVGRPEGKGPFPGMVLVHGGGGKAFGAWAEHWAKRGYVAIAMDTAGAGPSGRLPEGGPDQSDASKFKNFTADNPFDTWTYHAVAAVLRGHSLLLSLPEVDKRRTALTGISWGGYLTCIVAGLDHRFKAAVPVYGCGFLGENSFWKERSIAEMNPAARDLWLKLFDPSQYLAGVRCPILFLNGTHDFAYPLDSYQKSYRLVQPNLRHLSIVPKLAHGHIWTFDEVDQFIDRALRHAPFPRLTPIQRLDATAATTSTSAIQEAQLDYTVDTGPWDKRIWQSVPATIKDKSIEAEIPETVRTNPALTLLFTARTPDNLRVSTEYLQSNAQ